MIRSSHDMVPRRILLALLAAVTAACAPKVTMPVPAVIGAEERGLASWYGHPYHGRRTASGEIYDMNAMTAAHRTLPFDTWLHVENLDTGKSTRVRVNDRGPFVDGRVLDVSRAAGIELGAMTSGVVPVRLRVVASPPGPGTVFTVQVGAFVDDMAASALRRALEEAGFEAGVSRAEVNGQVVYRVRAGRFTARPDADAHAARLARSGYRGIVVTD
jgi:rare lipoprotein A